MLSLLGIQYKTIRLLFNLINFVGLQYWQFVRYMQQDDFVTHEHLLKWTMVVAFMTFDRYTFPVKWAT